LSKSTSFYTVNLTGKSLFLLADPIHILSSQNPLTMKTKNLLFIISLALFLTACSRAVTPEQAASGRYHRCRPVR